MSTVVKDLGAVSAYAYAVEKGYTGTEAEFAELMADYANVGQRAEDAAGSALNSKTAAQTAATTATNKASEATTAAQTATTKAGEAQTSAQTASSKASEASQSASQASGYAQTAETAKTDAQTAKTQADTARDEAVTAKTAAETAQGKAEDAQAAAESVAESIPSDYSQLSEDVSDLKEDLSAIEGTLTKYDNFYEDRVENGEYKLVWTDGKYINTSGGVGNNNSCSATLDYIPIRSGDVLSIYCHAPGQVDVIAVYDKSKTLVEQFTHNQASGVKSYTVEQDGFIRLSNEPNRVPNSNCYLKVTNLGNIKATNSRISAVEKDLQTLETAYDTYSTVPVTWDSDYDGKYIDNSGNIGNSESFHCSDLLVACYGSAEFKFDYSGTPVSVRIHGYNNAGVWVQQLGYATNITSGEKIAFSIPDNVAYLRISVPKTASDIVLNESVYGWINAQSGENIVTNNVPVVFSESSGSTAINASGLFISAPSHHYTDFLPVYAGSGKLSFAYSGTNVTTRVHGYSINKAWVRELGNLGGVSGGTIDFSIAEDVYYVRVSIAKTATNISIINTTTKDIISKYDIDKTNEARFAMKISSLGYIDDDIDISGDGTVYTLCGVKNRIVTGKPASPIGWLYMRSPSANEENQTELWYSGNQADKPQYLTTMNGFTPSSSHRDFEISPMHGDIITCRRDNRNKPFIYDAETHTTTLLNGLDINPIGWTSNRGADFAVDGNGNEYFMFGEYTGNPSTQEGLENVYIWKVTYPYNDPENWKIVHTIERSTQYEGSVVGKVWHFHTVQYDPYSGIWYATTGDSDAETVWYYSDDEGETWNILVYASEWESQIARIVCMVFEEDYVWWANDWGTNHSLNRVSRLSSGLIDISSRERIAELDKNQSTYAIVKTGYPNGLLMLDRLELGSLYRDDFFVQFYSFDDNMLHNLLNIKRLGERPTTDYSSSFGFRCKTYALRQSSFDTRIAVGFDSIYPNTMQIQGNEENNRLWTLFLDIT